MGTGGNHTDSFTAAQAMQETLVGLGHKGRQLQLHHLKHNRQVVLILAALKWRTQVNNVEIVDTRQS